METCEEAATAQRKCLRYKAWSSDRGVKISHPLACNQENPPNRAGVEVRRRPLVHRVACRKSAEMLGMRICFSLGWMRIP